MYSASNSFSFHELKRLEEIMKRTRRSDPAEKVKIRGTV